MQEQNLSTSNPVRDLEFSADDQTLADAHGRAILFWDLRSLRQQLATLGLDW